MNDRIGVLFVCLGNICRSPVAEAVFRQTVEAAGLADRFDIDSAGTTAYHAGDSPDERSAATAARRGLTLDHAARQVTEADLERFDFVIAMDRSNLGKLEAIAERVSGSVSLHLLRSFDESASEDEVPDPYFGGPGGFDDVHDMIERACEGLLSHIRERHDL